MFLCPDCKKPFDVEGKYNFCLNCEKQIKCKACGEILMPNKTICLVCGEPTVLHKSASGQINRYFLEEQQTTESASRRIELTLTDNAIEKAAPLFGVQFPLDKIRYPEPKIVSQEKLALPPSAITPTPPQESEQEFTDSQKESPLASNPQELEANSIFVKDDKGFLISQSVDYKGQSRKQQQERFILLYVWAYSHLTGQFVPSSKHISKAAENNSIYDGNFRIYLGKIATTYLTKVDDTYRVSPSGQVQIKQILSEIKNENIKGFGYWEGSKPRANRSGVKKTDQGELDKWIALESRCTNFDVRQFKNYPEQVMFALYDITKELAICDAVKPGLAYDYFKKKYKTVSIKKEQFTRTLNREEYKDKFGRTGEGLYYLTPQAEEVVKKWVVEGYS